LQVFITKEEWNIYLSMLLYKLFFLQVLQTANFFSNTQKVAFLLNREKASRVDGAFN